MSEYQSPIRYLYNSIITAFCNCSNQQIAVKLTHSLQNGLIISFDQEFAPIQTPCANLDTKEIQLHEAHLSYLWTVCYWIIGILEISYDNFVPDQGIVRLTYTDQFEHLFSAINWGASLKDMYRTWPEGIPSPNDPLQQVQFTNELFLNSIRYLMYHEFAHFTLHSDTKEFVRQTRNALVISKENAMRLRMMEIQADDFAFDCLFSKDESQSQLYVKVLGALIAHLSSFWLSKNNDSDNVGHPSFTFRLLKVLKKTILTEEPFITFKDFTVTVGLQVYLHLVKADYLYVLTKKGPYEDLQALQKDLIEVIDELEAYVDDPR